MSKPRKPPVKEHAAPCETCPYRKSVRLAFWDIREFQNLVDSDAPLGSQFNCHGESKRPNGQQRYCAGWLLDQRRRGTPNLLLRIKLRQRPALAVHYDQLKDLGKKLYQSIAEMFEANYPGRHWRPMQPKKGKR